MSLDPQTPIKLDVTLNEVEGVLAGLGELPTKSGAFGLMLKIQAQVQGSIKIVFKYLLLQNSNLCCAQCAALRQQFRKR